MKVSISIMVFALLITNSCKDSKAVPEQEISNSMIMDNDIMKSMSETSDMMSTAKTNGNFDFDFANFMIMHHQMAIDMSRVEMEKGSNKTIRDMANDIIVTQETEIIQLQQFTKNYKIPTGNNQISNSFKIGTEMKSMIQKMNAVKMTANIDKDFVAMMIPHHESAVAMAEMQLQYGTQNVMIDLAKKIIEGQTPQINKFKNWQTKN